MEQPPRRNWWSRNWKWALPVGCLLPIVVCGGGFGLFFFLVYGVVTGSIKASDAYADAMAQTRSNSEVVAALGEPIESGFWLSGSINVNGPSGNVDVSIPVSGPKGSGTLYVVGTKTAGRWQYSTMEVAVPGRAAHVNVRPRAP